MRFPTPGGGLGRGIAALIGMDREAITQRVKEGALPKLQQQIPVEAQEEALERIGKETAQRNADLRSKGLEGNDMVAVNDVLITGLSLRSRPEAVFVGGLFQWRGAPGQLGADAPQPPPWPLRSSPASPLTFMPVRCSPARRRAFTSETRSNSVHDLMITIKEAPPGTPPADAIKIAKNVDFPTYIKAVDESRKPGSRANVLRHHAPAEPPEFSADAKGNFVAFVHDLQLEVPAPESEAKGGVVGAAAKIYRIKMPQAEFAFSYTVETAPGNSPQLHAKVADFNPGRKRRGPGDHRRRVEGDSALAFLGVHCDGRHRRPAAQLNRSMSRCRRSICRASGFARSRPSTQAAGCVSVWNETRTLHRSPSRRRRFRPSELPSLSRSSSLSR